MVAAECGKNGLEWSATPSSNELVTRRARTTAPASIVPAGRAARMCDDSLKTISPPRSSGSTAKSTSSCRRLLAEKAPIHNTIEYGSTVDAD
jgi:hypothetical protein